MPISSNIPYFHTKKVNRGRQDELDIVKGLAIIFMVWCHVYRDLGADTTTIPGYFVDAILGGPFAAPMFMICMGIGIVYSHHQQPATLIHRGSTLLLMGYGLNIGRFVLPDFITTLITGKLAYSADWLGALMEVDIFQFAGLAFIAIALAKKLHLTNSALIIFAAMLTLLGNFLKNVATGDRTLDLFLGLFWKTQSHAYFTFFHWFIFPVAGLIIGDYLIHCTDKHTFYRKTAFGFFLLSLPFEAIALLLNIGLPNQFTQYFYLTLLDAIFLILFAISWFGFNDWWHEKWPKINIKILQQLSLHITSVYCVSWLWIGLLTIIKNLTWKNNIVGFLPISLLAFVILILSLKLALYYQRIKRSLF